MCNIDQDVLKNFAHLHVHTERSKDGMGLHSELVKHAKEIGYKYLAITDHGTMAGSIAHKVNCDENGIIPIFGIEGYTTFGGLGQRTNGKIKANHITILSRNKEGYDNLVALNNAAHRNIYKKGALKFPLMLPQDMKRYHKGLTVLTGCPASLTYHENYDVAATYIETLIKIFGDENVFAELMFVMEGQDFYTRPMQLAAEFGIETVITNDTHFSNKGDEFCHQIVTSIRSRAVSGTEYSYDSRQLWLTTPEEMVERASKYVDNSVIVRSFDNIKSITDSIEPFELKHEPVLPHVSKDEITKLKEIVLAKHEDYKNANEERREDADARLEKEWGVIDSFGFWNYFYIVNDIVYYCHKNDRLVSARGSAGGSYIIYLLGFSSVDPLKYGLIFERFLNMARHDYPDIDLDVDSSFRDELLEYCYTRWKLMTVNTVLRFGHRSLVNDLAKELNIKYEDKQALLECETGEEKFFKDFCKKNELFDRAYHLILGQQKSIGSHAAAVCSLLDETIIPIEAWGNEPGIAFSESGSSKELSYVGGVKIDILGLTTLSMLYNLITTTGVKPPENPDEEFPTEVFSSGNTLGIFQFDGSEGIREMCKTIKPKNLDELATINALYRPGPLNSGAAQHYIEYKKNPRKFHPDVDKILKSTYSVIIFQEQVMEIYKLITGGRQEDADLARRVLSPKSPSVRQTEKWQKSFSKVKKRFFDKGSENGYDKKLLNVLFDELETHSGYSFNLSHAANYANIARQMAWFKQNYPLNFYLATLNAYLTEGKTNKMQDFIWRVVEEGYTVEPPSVLYSSEIFELKNDKIYLPITLVKQVTGRSLEALRFLKLYVKGEHEDFDYENSINGVKYYNTILERFKAHNVSEVNAESLSLLSKSHVWNKAAKNNIASIGGYADVKGDLSLLYNKNDFVDVKHKLQVKAMGLLIPDKWYLKVQQQASNNPNLLFGVVLSKKNMTTKSGKAITAYRLTDNKILKIWSNLNVELPIGSPILAEVNKWRYIEVKNKQPRIRFVYKKI